MERGLQQSELAERVLAFNVAAQCLRDSDRDLGVGNSAGVDAVGHRFHRAVKDQLGLPDEIDQIQLLG